MVFKKILRLIIVFFTVLSVSSFKEIAEKDVHPYHVGSVEFIYNSKSKTFEITGKFFLDDLENGLKKKYGKAVHFNDVKYKNEVNLYLAKYFDEYLKLKADNKFLKINYVGYEEDNEAVNIYLESEMVEKPKKVEAAVSLLYNFFDNQMNIIHIVVDGKRQSDKLTYPNRYLYKTF